MSLETRLVRELADAKQDHKVYKSKCTEDRVKLAEDTLKRWLNAKARKDALRAIK